MKGKTRRVWHEQYMDVHYCRICNATISDIVWLVTTIEILCTTWCRRYADVALDTRLEHGVGETIY